MSYDGLKAYKGNVDKDLPEEWSIEFMNSYHRQVHVYSE